LKADRDSFIILLTLVPVVIGVILFAVWQATGSGPFDLPSFNFSLSTLPNFTYSDIPGLTGLVDGVQHMGSDAKTLAIGIGVGVVAGIVIAGIILDLMRGARKLAAARARNGSGRDSHR
jgi:ABC-type nitrate/sulfonate/bicarbonate transport system permease component